MASPTSTIGAELLGAAARITRWASREGRFSLPLAQARLLAQVEEHEPARIGDLARADHCSQPTMTAQVHRLEQHGLVTRHGDPGDGRAVLISLSSAGRTALTEVRTARATSVAPLIARLSREEQRQLVSAVAIIKGLLEGAAAEIDDLSTDREHEQRREQS
ncbi:MAG: MarR family winged helix-turn-helix transcriptional regulator [Nocardioidaceae bacterium]